MNEHDKLAVGLVLFAGIAVICFIGFLIAGINYQNGYRLGYTKHCSEFCYPYQETVKYNEDALSCTCAKVGISK